MANLTNLINAETYLQQYPETTQPIELIEGEVVVSPAPKDIHVDVVANLLRILFAHISKAQGQIKTAPADIRFDELNVLQPDIFYIAAENTSCKRGEDGYLHGAPDLCIEVISPGSAYYDRHKKPAIYARCGVREYWLVEPEARFIEIYTLRDGVFVLQGVYSEKETFSSPLLPAFTANVSDLFST